MLSRPMRGGVVLSRRAPLFSDFSIFPRLVFAWCSLRRVRMALFVSPIYVLLQLLQGILYTIPALLRNESRSLTLVSCWWSVEMVVNTVLMLYLLQTLLRSLLTPDTYGRQIVYVGFSSGCLPLLVFAAAPMIWSGYPFIFRTSVRCFSSLLMFSPTATVLARWNPIEQIDYVVIIDFAFIN